MTVYYCCLPSMLIKIAHDGFSRSVGVGAWQMKEVFGVTVAGVYVTDRPETALNKAIIPASGGPVGKAGCAGSELITEYGTIPFKVILRCIADPSGLLLEERRSTKSLLLFHAGCVVHQSCTLCWTTPSHGLVGNNICKLSRPYGASPDTVR